MVPILSLWMPIVLAAVLVFIASSLIHVVIKYHNSDYGEAPGKDAIMACVVLLAAAGARWSPATHWSRPGRRRRAATR